MTSYVARGLSHSEGCPKRWQARWCLRGWEMRGGKTQGSRYEGDEEKEPGSRRLGKRAIVRAKAL